MRSSAGASSRTADCTDLLRLMGSPNVSDAVKRQIEPLLREIDGAELTRNGRSG